MRKIQLTRGYETTVDDCDADLSAHRWYAEVSEHKDGRKVAYAVRQVGGRRGKKNVYMHRVIAERAGLQINDLQVDHVDGDGTNNRRENLRSATISQNRCNVRRRSDNKTGFKGVNFDSRRQKFRATIQLNLKQTHIGYFDSVEEAYSEYCRVAEDVHGEFARTS